MLKKILKLASLPLVAIVAMVSFSAFTGSSETNIPGHMHALCESGTSYVCKTRQCTTDGCSYLVNYCSEHALLDKDDCK